MTLARPSRTDPIIDGGCTALLAAIPAEVAVVDHAGTIVAVNDRWMDFARANGGATERVGPGTSYLEACERAAGPDSDGARVVANALRAVLDGRSSGAVLEYPCHAPGQQRWFDLAIVPLEVADARTGAVTFHSDVTARHEADQWLRTQAGMLDAAPIAIFAIDLQARVTAWNHGAEVLTGWTAAETIGRPLHERNLLALRDPDVQAALDAIAASTTWDGAIQITRRDRSFGRIHLTLHPLRGDDGMVLGYVGVAADLLDRENLAAELVRREARFAALVRNGTDAFFVNDPDGTITFASETVLAITGYRPDELIGKNGFDLTHPDDVERCRVELARATSGASKHRVEWRIRHADGTWRWVEGIATNRVSDPAVNGMVVNVRDVTDRHAVEAHNRFLATIAEQVPLAIHLVDETGAITYWNDKAEDLFGWTADEVIGRQAVEILSSEQQRAIGNELFARIRAGETIEGDFEVPHRSGDLIPVFVRAVPVRNPEGAIGGVMSTALDIRERRAFEQRLAASEARFRAILEHTGDVIAVLASDGRLRFWSPSLERILGYSRYDDGDVAPFVHPDDIDEASAAMQRAVDAPGTTVQIEVRLRHVDRTWRWFDVIATYPVDQRGVDGIVLNVRDITERRTIEQVARRGARQQQAIARLGLRALREGSIPTLFDVAAHTLAETLGVEFVYAARVTSDDELEFTTTYGWQPRTLGLTLARQPGRAGGLADDDGNPRVALLTPDRATAVDPSFADARSCAEVAVRGARTPYGVLGIARRDSQPFESDALHFLQAVANVLASAVDRMHAETELTRRSLHDPLTGLANRALLLDRIAQALAWQQRHGHQIALLLVNLDRFKVVNNSRGHSVGDEVLRAVGRRLLATMRSEDTVAHLGADDFAILTERVVDVHEAVEIATRVRRVLAQPLVLGGEALITTATIGMAVDGAEWDDPLEVLRDADTALRWGKERGGDRYEIYDAAMRRMAEQRLDLESDIRRALLVGELQTWFQPQIATDTGSLVGLEALVRWPHPERGLVPPDEFLPVARDSGLINAIDELVLTKAVEQLASRPDASDRRVSVNIGPQLLTAVGLDTFVADLLARTGIRPEQLCLEITEHMLLDDIDAARVALTAIHGLGVRISLDDFGTGYSSLQHITHLPIDEVKIDRSFVQNIDTDHASQAVVAAVVAMAKALGVYVVAEGVETAGNLEVIRALGCDAGQGYLWSPAIPAADLQPWFTPPHATNGQARTAPKKARTSSMSRSGSSSAAK
ncbi:MAG TPA: PAS domain S-box protein [Acidimicrobiia bacterium]|nr:PAS domain S-box protein [Acidimicrobiia bacterium]